MDPYGSTDSIIAGLNSVNIKKPPSPSGIDRGSPAGSWVAVIVAQVSLLYGPVWSTFVCRAEASPSLLLRDRATV